MAMKQAKAKETKNAIVEGNRAKAIAYLRKWIEWRINREIMIDVYISARNKQMSLKAFTFIAKVHSVLH